MSKNIIRNQIFTCIEIAKRSRVPFLFISNPGYGKTTCVNLYAKTFGYHVETLIGSHYSQDEILGFQANTGGNSLSILKPEWYTRILYAQSKHVPSILFLDELSTVSPNVQGALLQLVFERKLRGGNKLPDDCIVIAAANYKQNLPGFCDLIAPVLNRFCIINLLPQNKGPYQNAIEILDEFTQDFNEVSDDLPVFKDNRKFSEDENRKFLDEARKNLSNLFNNHKKASNTSNSLIDFRNTFYDGIYDRNDSIPEVLNFMSPRTISYYLRVVRTMCEMNINPDDIVVKKITEGLLGLGTNTFTADDEAATKAQINFLRNELLNSTTNLMRSFSCMEINETKEKTEPLSPVFSGTTISSKIRNYISCHDMKSIACRDLAPLMKEITSGFNRPEIKGTKTAPVEDKTRFRGDYESVKLLYGFISRTMEEDQDKASLLAELENIINVFRPYYQDSFTEKEA